MDCLHQINFFEQFCQCQQLCSSPTIGFLLNYNFNKSFDSIFQNSNQDINIRIKEILDLKKYFKTQIGINQLLDLKDSLVASGYPENAAQLEIDFFLELFDDTTELEQG